MTQSFGTLDDIYRYLGPTGLTPSAASGDGRSELIPRDISTLLLDLFGNNGAPEFLSISKMIDKIQEHVTTPGDKNGGADKVKDYDKKYFIIGPTGHVDFVKGSPYWQVPSTRVPLASSGQKNPPTADIVDFKIASDILSQDTRNLVRGDDSPVDIAIFATRDPYVSQSTKACDVVSRFLNYTPTVIASQLVPYLDISFCSPYAGDESTKMLNKPSLMRFLLGSVDMTNYSDADKALFEGTQNGNNTTDPTASVTSMDAFLAPQTLTNMDTLASDSRATRVKPFVPFASIEGFDVKIQNAGAGKFASKRASLKFRIHDKGRLSEFSEFVRGSVGYNKSIIWTTWGWIAPRSISKAENEYFDFINRNMLVRDAWKVVNTQFSFDSSGQLTFTLDLYSAGGKGLQEVNLSTSPTYDAKAAALSKAIETLAGLKSKYLSEDQFSSDMQVSQVLNAATSTGDFKDLKSQEVAAAFAKIDGAAKKSIASKEDLDAWDAAMSELRGGGEKGQSSRYGDDLLNATAPAAASTFFQNMTRSGLDLFLPDEARKDYYPKDLIPLLKAVSSTVVAQKKSPNQATDDSKQKAAGEVQLIDLPSAPPLVSFGKLFMDVLVASNHVLNDCNELQVYFYSLNPNCGPVSGLSVAEFPIELVPLAYAYAEMLKTNNTATMTLQEFLRLVVETSFNDQRAPGYGMAAYYKPFDKSKPKDVETITQAAVAQAGLEKWYTQYGSLKIPVIEMFVETGVYDPKNPNAQLNTIIDNLKSNPLTPVEKARRVGSDEPKIIKRIHVYDKQCNPHMFAQQIFADGNEVKVGNVDTSDIRASISTALADLEKNNKAVYDSLIRDLETGSDLSAILEKSSAAIPAGDKPSEAKAALDKAREAFKRISDDTKKGFVIGTKGDKSYARKVKAEIAKTVPSILPGTNGSLVHNINLSSKTDGALAAKNLAAAYKGSGPSGKATLSDDGFTEKSGLPIRVVPAQLTMTTHGVPKAQLYQTYFVDFDTGTTIDNLYLCTSLQHNMAKGKFTTTWNFAYSSGYAKYDAPPTVAILAMGQAKSVVAELKAAAAEREAQRKANARPPAKKPPADAKAPASSAPTPP